MAKKKESKTISPEEYKILAYYVACNSKAQTCREFMIEPESFDKWLKQPLVRIQKRSMKKALNQTRARTLQRLEGIAFEALERQMIAPYKSETRAQAAKIVLDEQHRRYQESDLADMVDALQDRIDEATGDYMAIETIEEEE